MSRTKTISTGFAIAALSLFALTGCGGGPSGTAGQSPQAEAPASDQSKTEACQVLKTELTELNTEVNSANGELSSAVQSGDTSGARDMFTKIGTRIDEISKKITNPEVSTAFESYSTTWDDFEKLLVKISDAVDAKDQTALQAAAGDLTTGISGFTDVAKELSDVCS